MASLDRVAAISDLRLRAKRRLPRSVFEFIDGGAGDERTLRANEADFREITLLPSVGVDVAARDMSATIVGAEAALPLVMAPTGLAGFFWPEGEAITARVAKRLRIPYCLSTNSIASIEEVAAATRESERWFQLYFLKDKALMEQMLDQARSTGYRVLCLTLDLPVQGRRDRDVRNAFTVPLKPRLDTVLDMAMRPAWLLGVLRSDIRFGNFASVAPPGGFSSIARHVASLCDAGASWDTVEKVMKGWPGPVVVKGVLRPDDARRAVDLGAAAVIVSNHGGRQLDDVPSAISALPAIVEAVRGDAQVILDGGVRRGASIVKAKALGADACMIGRGVLWGLAAAGEAGVEKSIGIYRDELDIAMALMGRPTFRDIGPDAIAAAAPQGR